MAELASTIVDPVLVEGMSADDYHADPAIGSSMLCEFLEDPDLFADRYVFGKEELRAKSDAMKLGDVFHVRLLEPERFHKMVAPVKPDFKKSPDNVDSKGQRSESAATKWCKNATAAWEAKYSNLIQATQEERDNLERMAEAVAGNQFAKHVLYNQPGLAEASIFWTDATSGIRLKCRWDWFADIGADIKTSRSRLPGPYAKQAASLRYHVKKIHYQLGARALDGVSRQLLHIVVQNCPPFQCAVYDLDDAGDDGVRSGWLEWQKAMTNLARCFESGDWRHACEQQVTKLRLPSWAAVDHYEV